jgi:hypothetical protein
MTKRWSSTRSDLTMKREASKKARRLTMAEAQAIWDAQVERHTRPDGTVDIEAFNAESAANRARRLEESI